MRTLILIIGLTACCKLISGTLQNDIPERPSISLYSDESKLLHSSRIVTSCENIPVSARGKFASIDSEACVILYSRIDCAEESYLKLTHEAGFANNEELKNCVSFRACKNTSGQNPFRDYRVGIYRDGQHLNDPILDTPISSKCINFNYYGDTRASNIISDICINYFSGPDCVGNYQVVKKGHVIQDVNESAGDYQTFHESFKPCNENDIFSPQFHRLAVNVFAFYVVQVNNDASTSKNQLISSEEFQNMENFVKIEMYSVHKNLTTSIDIQRVIGNSQFTNFATAGIKNITFQIKSEVEDNIRESLTRAYNFSHKSNQTLSRNFSLSAIYPIDTDKKVELLPCTTCKLTTSVVYKKDQFFAYTARATITGVNIRGDVLRPEEIVEVLPNTFKYIQDGDNKTIEVEFRENLIANYFIETNTSKACSNIVGCNNDCAKTPGFYQASAGTCGECHGQCKTCNGKFLEDCLECYFAREGNVCVKTCNLFKREVNGFCVECSKDPEPDCNLSPPQEKLIEEVDSSNGGYTFIFIGIGIAVAVVVIVAIMAVYIKRHGHLNASGTYNVTKATSADNTRPESKMLLNNPPPPPREIQAMKAQKVLETSVDMEPPQTLEDERDDPLELIMEDIRVLETEVEKFEGPHFTKIYRTLQGDCTKLNMDLDKINVDGRDKLRNERRKLFQKIEQLADELAKKAHEDGQICELCEVKE